MNRGHGTSCRRARRGRRRAARNFVGRPSGFTPARNRKPVGIERGGTGTSKCVGETAQDVGGVDAGPCYGIRRPTGLCAIHHRASRRMGIACRAILGGENRLRRYVLARVRAIKGQGFGSGGAELVKVFSGCTFPTRVDHPAISADSWGAMSTQKHSRPRSFLILLRWGPHPPTSPWANSRPTSAGPLHQPSRELAPPARRSTDPPGWASELKTGPAPTITLAGFNRFGKDRRPPGQGGPYGEPLSPAAGLGA